MSRVKTRHQMVRHMPKQIERKVKTLKAVQPNAGVEAWYTRRLTQRIQSMSRSVSYWIIAQYRATGMAQDALGPNELATELQRLTVRWNTVFSRLGKTLSQQLASRVQSHADQQLETSLRAAGFKVKFQQTQEMKEAYAAVVQEQVGLIKSIPQQYMTEVQGLVMRSAARGRDIAYLVDELKQRYAITHRRATFIARDQNNKATTTMTAARQLQLGIEEGVWKHSHAGKQPRPEHVKANGKRFSIRKGMLIEGEHIMPGEEPNCRCVWEPIIPGFED